MILVDKDIKARVSNGELIVGDTFDLGNVNAVSYDLTIERIQDGGKERTTYDLAPNETVFIKTKEVLSIPNDLMGRIGEKNSRMRMGLEVAGPHYYPGHTTKAFLRVRNISDALITIKEGDKIAQIFFEQLKDVPDVPYNSTFQNEKEYSGFGAKYQAEYEKRIHSVEKVKENIEDKEQQIYSNVLTLMGIFVAIFSLISINFQAASNAALDRKFILTMNVSLCFCITVMLGLILIFLNKAKNKTFVWIYAAILVALGILTIVLCL
jgi:deoxycytidine triphosphate deaminase